MRVLLFATVFTLAACDATTPDLSADARAEGPQLVAQTESDAFAQIRRATAKYHRVERALADGYVPASPCVADVLEDGTEVAAMGYHYVNFGLVEDPAIDANAPEILLYEPQRNGTLRLVGVEFMTPAAAWDPAAPPTFEGEAFAAHLTPEVQHGIPFPHYDLHVWTWRSNPNGMFKPMNPKVSCHYAPTS